MNRFVEYRYVIGFVCFSVFPGYIVMYKEVSETDLLGHH